MQSEDLPRMTTLSPELNYLSEKKFQLSRQDMDLIEVLWKQDVDLGLPLDPDPAKLNPSTSEKKTVDELEKLKALEAINATKNEDDKKEPEEQKEDDPWAGLSYTIDLETGEHILSANSPSGSGTTFSSGIESSDHLLGASSLNLEDSPIGFVNDSLGLDDDLNLEDDFTSELLSDSLLGPTGVEGLLCNDSLGLPDGFNLEEALQLVGLDEATPEDIKQEEIKKKTQNCGAEGSSSSKEEKSLEDSEAEDMIHTPQFHHPHHSHHRSFQSRVPFMRGMNMDQRWPDISSLLSVQNGTDHYSHPTHAYPGHGISHHHSHYDNQRNVLLHNATLAPPVGDLNSTGPYHSVGGPSNLGSAVATSMNLTNSSEPMGSENSAYKSEPSDMMYYHTPTSDSINQTNDALYQPSFLDDEINLMDMVMNDNMYSMRMLDNSSNNASGPTGAAALPGVHSAGNGTVLTTVPGVTDERMDASSDSAVSSMGSERVPSLSDGEWMETGSNSSHTQADSHYSMDYASKYRMPYDCNYTMAGRNGVTPRCQGERISPVAQKKHQMFAKRYFQEQGTGSPLGTSGHPTTLVKYEYDTQTVGAGAPGNAYSGPIEGAAGPQAELKYSCSVDFSRHQTAPQFSGRTPLDHVQHNHTYHLPADSLGAMQRPLSRDKKSRRSDIDEHLTRDEKRARALNIPIAVQDIINLPMDEFNERMSKIDLSEAQLGLIRDIRRRGKNKVAAQNCRKRKLDQIVTLADQVKEMRDRKTRLIRERDYMLVERQRVKDKFSQLYRHIFQSLRDPDGNQYYSNEWSLQQSADGNVLLVPRNQTNSHHSRSNMEPKTKPDPEHKE
ncbi:segmentation protein cap'n'collar-like isoform X2 [Aphidius gifuensis]|uniref:segmentation protein cap'n'collar-like isoform X2 n=1 Tax=Aphidius gifuensis TaxID=684658 RepID=UPI001CDB6BE3|nr:segmentation protein cap'n'collar-like isoform X2 [Aphidius gifuensis]